MEFAHHSIKRHKSKDPNKNLCSSFFPKTVTEKFYYIFIAFSFWIVYDMIAKKWDTKHTQSIKLFGITIKMKEVIEYGTD